MKSLDGWVPTHWDVFLPEDWAGTRKKFGKYILGNRLQDVDFSGEK